MYQPSIILFLNLGTGEVFFIVLMILIFFGADKLPAMARTLGKGMREMKNATAEIQKEIERSATEIQRDVNIGEQTDELKEAADKMRNGIKEGLNTLEQHYSSDNKPADETSVTPVTPAETTEEEPPNPLTPPNAIKRS
jgi:sec-independent protein translocase protein TatA